MEIFKYDSPLSQAILKIADTIILNILYLICCIPVFTIGAAQAGLYTAAKVMFDKEDDTSLVKAFFRGFKAGFGTITVSWGITTLLLIFVIWIGVASIGLGASFWPVLIAFCLISVYQCTLPLFHSRFSNSVKMLMRNTLFFIMAYPVQCVGNALLVWGPVILYVILDLFALVASPLWLYMALTPLWVAFYYSTAMLFGFKFSQKPFETLIAQQNCAPAEEHYS